MIKLQWIDAHTTRKTKVLHFLRINDDQIHETLISPTSAFFVVLRVGNQCKRSGAYIGGS